VKQPPPESQVLVDPQACVGIVGEASTPAVIGTRTALIPRLVFALPTNKSGPAQITPWRLLADHHGYRLGDPAGNLIAPYNGAAVFVHRLLFARRTNRMPISRRYTPELAPGETSVFGMSFEYVIPKGIGIVSGSLEIYNVADGVAAGPADAVTAGAVSVQGRLLYATVTATQGADGIDYGLIWFARDTDGNIWPRTGVVLCAYTS
jgi:hypothetical protein